MKKRVSTKILSVLTVASLALVSNVHAFDLLQAWEMASEHDPQQAMSKASVKSAQALQEQAQALWKPIVFANATTGLASSTSLATGAQFSAPGFGRSTGVEFGTSVNQGVTHRWALNAKQAVYDVAKRAQQNQLNSSAKASELNATWLEQQLALITIDRYFNVMLAQSKHALIHQQLEAVHRSWVEAKDRYEIGDAPVTDVYEASSRAKALQAQLNSAQTELQMTRLILADSMGVDVDTVSVKSLKATPFAISLDSLSQVLTQAQDHHLSLQLRALEVDSAKQEAIKFTHAASPVVELIAAVSKEQLHGQGDFGASNNSQSQKMLGLSLSLPLYTAGSRDGKFKESLASSDKRVAEYDVSHAQLLQAIKSTWMSLKSAPERVLAYDEALMASAARRDATRTGKQVGDKTTLELLSAENDLLQAHVSALQARLEALYNQAKLDVLRGRLTPDTFKKINDALAP